MSEWLDTLYTWFGLAYLEIATSHRGYKIRRANRFGTLRRQGLDLYVPDNVAAYAPVVVFFYGGGWRSGGRRRYRFVGECFASAGLIVAIPDYRIYPPTIFPGFVDDGAAAVAWVAKNVTAPDGGSRPLILAGASAGAHIAALLHFDRKRLVAAGIPEYTIAGLVGLCGPYDFLPIQDPRYQPIFPPDTDVASQPINFVDGTAPPAFLLTGDADTVVDPGNTTRLAAAIRSKGGTVSEVIYPGADHAAPIVALARAHPREQLPVRAAILDFIRETTGFVAKDRMPPNTKPTGG